MRVADLQHFVGMDDSAPAPARRMAEQLMLIVRAATAGPRGVRWVSAVGCTRRRGRGRCNATLALTRDDEAAVIEWACAGCEDHGVVTGWEHSPYDLRPPHGVLRAVPDTVAECTLERATVHVLHQVALLDPPTERLLFAARMRDTRVVLAGTAEDFEELAGFVAAEAGHTPDRAYRRQLDDALAVLESFIVGLDT